MTERWTVNPPQALAWRHWDGQTVVHHQLSNDTHRLADPAGWILERVALDGPVTIAELEAAGTHDAESLGAVLETLASLGLVERC
jgi:PqqD family protein of HPr-rel-A system